jgi:hypothetical protein
MVPSAPKDACGVRLETRVVKDDARERRHEIARHLRWFPEECRGRRIQASRV